MKQKSSPFYKKLWFKILAGIVTCIVFSVIALFFFIVETMKEIQIDEGREINESIEEMEREEQKTEDTSTEVPVP